MLFVELRGIDQEIKATEVKSFNVLFGEVGATAQILEGCLNVGTCRGVSHRVLRETLQPWLLRGIRVNPIRVTRCDWHC